MRILVAIVLSLITIAAMAKQPDSCSQFSTSSMTFQELKRPQPPICLDTLSMMSKDSYQIEICKAELTAYADKMDKYSKCLMDENRMSILEGNSAIDKFNCIVRGSPVCY